MKSVDTSLKSLIFPNINEDGWKFISILAICSLILLIIWLPLGCVSVILTVWCFYAFRDPDRIIPNLNDIVVAPIDGKVISITREKGPDVLGLGNKTFTRIGIFTSISDVSVGRMPLKSKIQSCYYDDEVKFSHSFDKNNIGNERMLFAFKNISGKEFVLEQTSTFCAPRIKYSLKKGDEFSAGQRFGIMRFGGFTDIYLPEKSAITICVGQTLIGGETIIADLNSDAPRIDGEIR